MSLLMDVDDADFFLSKKRLKQYHGGYDAKYIEVKTKQRLLAKIVSALLYSSMVAYYSSEKCSTRTERYEFNILDLETKPR